MQQNGLGYNPMHIYSEVSPTECNGAYTQESVLRIAALCIALYKTRFILSKLAIYITALLKETKCI